MRRLLLALCCSATSVAAQQTRAMIALPGYLNKFPIEDVTTPFTLDAPLNQSFAAVKAAFAGLKVPLDVDDSVSGIVGKQNATAQVSFAGYRLSRVLDCGMNTLGAPNADTYRVSLVLLALLDPVDSTHTKLRVGFVGGAVPNAGTRADGVQCGSTGVIEAKLAGLASARLK